jgi:hypothetical protein
LVFTTTWGHYCYDVNTDVQSDQIVVNFLSCSGGTNLLTVRWEQRWIRCRAGECAVVWSGERLSTECYFSWYTSRSYAITEIQDARSRLGHVAQLPRPRFRRHPRRPAGRTGRVDGAGIRLADVDGDGRAELLAGLPLIPLAWPRAMPTTTARRFQVYRWDGAAQQFTAREVWTP